MQKHIHFLQEEQEIPHIYSYMQVHLYTHNIHIGASASIYTQIYSYKYILVTWTDPCIELDKCNPPHTLTYNQVHINRYTDALVYSCV